ncbi:MAG: hypothetical protein KDB79_15620 [Acidobacteria bacterium]|nr:hypothetical protein [Acidobacteriota bacterium]
MFLLLLLWRYGYAGNNATGRLLDRLLRNTYSEDIEGAFGSSLSEKEPYIAGF